jgi:sodium transport system ATP-binding protein
MKQNVSVTNITKSFHQTIAVDIVSFEIKEKEIYGLLGPNGAGKTTTIRMIATLLSPTSGSITVGDFDTQKEAEKVRSMIGVLTTDIGVYDRLSGRENLAYYGTLYGLNNVAIQKQIEKLAKMLEMEWFIDRAAGGYSTGMKQKLAIARSVIHDPKVLIFDEPTTGLDVLASQTVLDFIKQAKKDGKSVIFSTHQMGDAQLLCDRIGIMNKGKLITEDTVEGLLKRTKTHRLEDAFLDLISFQKGKSNE